MTTSATKDSIMGIRVQKHHKAMLEGIGMGQFDAPMVTATKKKGPHVC